ncbi:MAG TPA: serine protease [Thiobacillus sp.]
MNRKSLLPGLYRNYLALPGRVRRLAGQWLSKRHTRWVVHPQGVCRQALALRAVLALLALVLAAPARADVADMLINIKPGVVGVGTFRPAGSPRANLLGTGFAVLDGRYVVSCAHIFAGVLNSEKNETHAVFIGHDRQVAVRIAQLIATDRAHDLAVLKIAGSPLPALKLGDSTQAREGWQLYFTGYPIGSILGLNPSTHRAGLAAIIPIFTSLANAAQLTARALKQAQQPYEVFELDAIAYPGNSGSPVWNPETGEVLGVVNSVFVKGAKEAALSAPSGITYAIPVKYLQPLLEQAQAKPIP